MADEEMSDEVRKYFSRRLSKIAKSGGEARAKKLSAGTRKRIAKKASEAAHAALTPKQRSARAKKAAEAMWAKRRRGAQKGGGSPSA